MDEHRELFEALPSEARPYGIEQLPCGEWEFDKCPSSDIECHERIERAAMVWLMGRGWILGEVSLIPMVRKQMPPVNVANAGGFVQALLAAVRKEAENA